VTIVVTATNQVLQGPLSIGNSATLTVPGTTFPTQIASGSATVNDFSISVPQPAPPAVIAGAPANYTVNVTPTGSGFPESVSLACGSGLPSSASCTFTNNPIPNLSNGPQSRALEITTTARVTTPAGLFRRAPTYAIWLPIFGVGLMGAGISRKRRMLLSVFFALVLAVALLQAGCGSSKRSTRTTTGTPAGTYTVTVNATSGSATRTTTVQLTVQ